MINKEERFKKIIKENDNKIRSICKYYAPEDDAQKDIYQEILINIWKSLESYRGDSLISTWLYRIAINTALGFSGKAFKRMKLHVDFDNNIASILTDNSSEEFSLKEMLVERLNIEINQLSVIEKALISLKLEGISLKEIADIIGITEPNVRVKIHRIKEKLKHSIQQ